MADGSAWLKAASPSSIAEAVRTMGPVAFLAGGLSEFDVANVASKAIDSLSRENLTLSTFFHVHTGDDIERVVFDATPISGISVVRVTRTTHFVPVFDENPGRSETVYGPIIPVELGAMLCKMFNEYAEKRLADRKWERGW